MSCITIALDPAAEQFYRQIAERAGISLEKVLADTLFKLAGELALEAIARRSTK